MFLLLTRDGNAHTVASQVLPHRATTVGLVTHQTTRPAFGAPPPLRFTVPPASRCAKAPASCRGPGVRTSVINFPAPSGRIWTFVLQPP